LEQVTPEIVDEIVKDFRLSDDFTSRASTESGFCEPDFQPALNTHMGVYAAPRSIGAAVTEASSGEPFEARKHEPHI
jgi:hypothetical protein